MNIINSTPFRLKVVALAIASSASTGYAFNIDTGNSDLRVSLDNTVKYSNAFRVKDRSDALSKGDAVKNLDDGNNNFDKGMVSNRLDLLTEFNVSYQDRFGLRLSSAAWYDDVYHRTNDNTTSSSNSPVANEFVGNTKDVMGGDIELLDAVVYARFPVKDGMEGTIRAGRHSLLWGESLFYGMNGIAASNGPVDVVKLTSVPNSTFKETMRPTGRVSLDLPLTESVSLGAFVGYEWEKSRLQPQGAYLSVGDPVEGEKIQAGGPQAILKNDGDIEASDSGQYGLQLKVTDYDLGVDYGFYATRYHSAGPANNYFYQDAMTFNGGNPAGPRGTYKWVYAEGIESYGASLAKTVGRWSLAGEVSYRKNAPLASLTQNSTVVFPAAASAVHNYNGSSNPGYAVGETAHIQFNWLANVPSFIAQEASLLGEIAWNTRVKVTENESMLNPLADKSAVSMRVVYAPTYRQVFDGVDLSPSLGVSHTVGKSSAIGPAFGVDGGGDVNIGIKAVYLNKWNISMSYTSYYGEEGPYLVDGPVAGDPPRAQFKQASKDRDFISASVSTTF